MANTYMVEIGDESGNSFKVSVSTNFSSSSPGNWRAIDKGYIRFNNGPTMVEDSNGTLYTRHVKFVSGEGTWGIRLNDFEDIVSVNKEGSGFVYQSWVLGLKSGRISWAVVG